MRFQGLPLLIGAFALSAPVLAQTVDTPVSKPAKVKKPHKICRDVEKPGSHLVASVCKTKAEWDGTPEVEGNLYIPGNRTASRGS